MRQERSQLNRVADIERPLQILQGANDPPVRQAQSDRWLKLTEAPGPSGSDASVSFAKGAVQVGGEARPVDRIGLRPSSISRLAITL
ncbi:hypothetical protein [Martelella sp. HB161492]|uniref:hypothetical protein n=1 Tax=Martelella sp. HB161492 TaxID=2720726 RepID=UPI0015917777|nr:hypothetical protein [Martelella sp. HB161492]